MNRIPIPYYVIYWQPLIEFNSRWLTQPSVWSWTSTAALIGWPTWWVSVILRNWSYISCLQVKEGKKITGPEQLKDAAFGCARIRGDTLGIVGLGKLKGSVSYSYLWTQNFLWRGFWLRLFWGSILKLCSWVEERSSSASWGDLWLA